MATVNDLFWQTTRGFQETSMLLEHVGRHMQENGGSARADLFLTKARELNQQASQLQRMAIGHESLSAEYMRRQQVREGSDNFGTGE